MDECEYLLKTGQYIKYAIGVDLGNNDAKRGTVLSLIGITRGYKHLDVIDATDCQSTESNALVHEICTHIEMWHNEIPNLNAIDSIRIDGFGAVQILIPTIRKELINRKIRTLTDLAIKFGDSAGRKARLDLNLLMISRKVLRWSQRPGAQKSKAMFKKLKVVSAENLILPATTLTQYCYRALFSWCTYLEEAPQLPATTLAKGVYWYMFERCAITTAPDLLAEHLVAECYGSMFV